MKKSEKIITSLLLIAFGVLLIVLKDNFIGILMTIVGVSLIVLGIIDLFGRYVPPAVVKMISGVFIIICGWAVMQAVLYIVAAALLIVGILLLYDKIKHRVKCDTLFYTVCEYAVPVIAIGIGALLLFHQGAAVNFIFITSGVLTIVEGGLLLFNVFADEYL